MRTLPPFPLSRPRRLRRDSFTRELVREHRLSPSDLILPVFVREGSIIPEQEPSDYSNAKPLDTLIINVYGSGKGQFDLYEDDGVSLDYAKGSYAVTRMSYDGTGNGSHELTVAAVKGTYNGQPLQRAYEVRIHALSKPQSVSVDGAATNAWSWNGKDATAVVAVPRQDIHDTVSISWR